MPNGRIPGIEVDPATRALAEQATQSGVSQSAQLDRTHADNLRDIKNALAARGILSSGETGFQMGNENKDYTVAQSDALNNLLDYIKGVQQAFTQTAQDQNAGLAEAAQTAMQTQSGLPQNQPTDPFQAKLVKGTGWYTANGKVYGQDGHAINVQAQAQALHDKIRQLRQSGMSINHIKRGRAWRRLQFLLGLG